MTETARRTCFVASPIGDAGTPTRGHADWLLDEIIKPVFDEHFKDFNVVRADGISSPGMIDSQVINHLLDADLVVADLSFQNPNVFYEIGLRHMERKPIIHMFRIDQVIPFDVKPYRSIPFTFEHPKQRFEARELLKQAIDAVLANDFKVENPVTRARGFAELSKHAMPGQEIILAEIQSLKKEVQAAYMTAISAQSVAQMAANAARGVGVVPGVAAYGVAGGYGVAGSYARGTVIGSGDSPDRGALSDHFDSEGKSKVEG
jgi:hypothetical protein